LQFRSELVDNYDVHRFGAPLGDEPTEPDGTGPSLEAREPYLRRVLEQFEAGGLEPYEYTRRVLAINAASSLDEVAAIAQQPPDGSLPGVDPATRRGFDAVDLALLRAQSSEPLRPTMRYVSLAVVFVLFAVLIGLGMWLATRVHGSAMSPRTTIGHAAALVVSLWS
jgi:hypothetical protein